MAKTKKPKKKYRPREVYIPSILNAHFTFGPFEEALEKIIETGEIEIDDAGIMVYKDIYGKNQSFESGLKIYIKFISIYTEHIDLNLDTKPFEVLKRALEEGTVIDEENIDDVMLCFKKCRELVAVTPPAIMTKLMAYVRAQMNQEKTEALAEVNEKLYTKEELCEQP